MERVVLQYYDVDPQYFIDRYKIPITAKRADGFFVRDSYPDGGKDSPETKTATHAAKSAHYALFRRAMADLYAPGELTLKAAQKPDFDHGRFDTAARYVYNCGGFTPEMKVSRACADRRDEPCLGSTITVSHETPPN
ncbi:MAG: hypothetical protein V8Q54_03445 [Alistipes senegalensis]